MKAVCRQVTRSGKTLGLVPTMGALHEGHLSLARAARARCDVTAVSIFVNPLQFGPTEDLAKYPRTLERDCALLEELGVELVFVPTVDEMYFSVKIQPRLTSKRRTRTWGTWSKARMLGPSRVPSPPLIRNRGE